MIVACSSFINDNDCKNTHDSITRSQLEALFKLKRSTACVRLNELVKSGFLRKVGHNRETAYILA